MKKQKNNFFQKNILEIVAKLILIYIACYGVLYFVNTIIAKVISPTEYGVYGLIINTISTLGMYVMLGFDEASGYFIALYHENKKWNFLRGYYNFILKGFLYIGTPLFLLGMILFGSNFLNVDFSRFENVLDKFEMAYPVTLFLWAIPLIAILYILRPILYSLEQPKIVIFLLGIFLPVIHLILILAVFFLLGRNHIYYMVMAYFCTLIFIISAMLIFIRIETPQQVWRVSLEKDVPGWVKFAFPLFIYSALSSSIETISLFSMKLLHVNQEYLGFYEAIVVIGGFLLKTIPYALLVTQGAHIITYLQNKDYEELQKTMDKGFYILVIFSASVLLLLMLFGKYMLHQFGAKYEEAYYGLIIYGVANSLNMYTLIGASLLSYTNNGIYNTKKYAYGILILIISMGTASYYQMSFSELMSAYLGFQVFLFLMHIYYVKQRIPAIRVFPRIF